MSNVVAFISATFLHHPIITPLLLGVISVIHGETGILLFLYFVSKNQIGFTTFLIIAYSAIMTYELVVYGLGHFLRGTRLGKRLEERIKHHQKIERYLHNESVKLIILSRFVIYFSVAVTFLSGWTRVPFKHFLKLRAMAVAAWLLIMTGLILLLISLFGELSGNSIFHRIEIAIAFIVILVILLEIFMKKVLEKKLIGNGNKNRDNKNTK